MLLFTSTGPFPISSNITYFVEVENQVQLTYVPKERIQYFDKEVYRLEICQLVVIGINAGAEEQSCVPPVYDFGHVAELDKV